jgi:NAD kinase
MVVPRGLDLVVENRTDDVSATVLADGHPAHQLAPGEQVTARLSEQRSLLATLPESTFFSRYRRVFAS